MMSFEAQWGGVCNPQIHPWLRHWQGRTHGGGGAVIFVWSSPTFGGKTGHEDLFFGLHRIWGVHERIHELSKGTNEQKVGKPCYSG